MKRLALILAVVLLVSGCAGAGGRAVRPHHYGSFDEVMHIHVSPAPNWRPLESIADLEEMTPNIVRARMGDDAEIVFQINELRPERPSAGHNIVSIEILEVIKGDLQAGETIRIVEPYYINDGTLISFCSYLPSIPGREYFLFLSYPITRERGFEGIPEEYLDAFWVIHGANGRFYIPNAGADLNHFTAEDLSMGAITDLHLRLWQEVIDAYMN